MMIESLAEEFAHELLSEIGKKNMCEVIRKNHQADYEGCCASHDFCDANMVMNEAFVEIYGREPIFEEINHAPLDLNDNYNQDSSIWNEAWDTAKLHEFYFDPRS